MTCVPIFLTIVKRTSPLLLEEMKRHYSHPKGFVGRNICYAITVDEHCYGHIVGGSATRFLPGRDAFLGWDARSRLNNIVNNIFFHVEPHPLTGKYPVRNFTTACLNKFENEVVIDWFEKYNDCVLAMESLIELPRNGECYRRAKWTQVGITKGYTCKRVAGIGTDSWSGKRVWDTNNLRPKAVFMKHLQPA